MVVSNNEYCSYSLSHTENTENTLLSSNMHLQSMRIKRKIKIT